MAYIHFGKIEVKVCCDENLKNMIRLKNEEKL